MTNAEFVREIAQPLSDSADGYDGLIESIGDARFCPFGRSDTRHTRVLLRARCDYQAAHRREGFLNPGDRGGLAGFIPGASLCTRRDGGC
jgi:hypothetical protein